MTRCLDCRQIYDETRFLASCPHDQTVTGRPYCKTHDRFDCPAHSRQGTSPRDRQHPRAPRDRATTRSNR